MQYLSIPQIKPVSGCVGQVAEEKQWRKVSGMLKVHTEILGFLDSISISASNSPCDVVQIKRKTYEH